MRDNQSDAALQPGAQASELWLRISVTLAALIVYRAGCHLPIPGLDGAAVAAFLHDVNVKSAIERISVLSLGLMPLLSALILAELGKIILPGFRRWAEANGARLNRYLRIAAVGLAMLQGLGIALGLEDVAGFVAAPGSGFRTSTVATLVGGTAFLIWLADLITRYGLGSGFWLLLAAPVIAEVPSVTAGLLELVGTGSVSQAGALLFAGYLVAATAALVALAKANGGAEFPRGAVSPWPPLLAYASLGWLFVALMVVPSETWREAVMSVLDKGHPVKLVLLALFVGLFALSYANPSRESGRGAAGLAAVAAMSLIGIVLLPELLASWFNMPLVVDGRWLVIIVTVALGVLATCARERGEARC
jgi:preprotein translocase subunit SecY